MNDDYYYKGEKKKDNKALLLLIGQRDKRSSFDEFIPERYKRKEYIIDKIKT